MSEQYATDANLRARITLHQRFSTAKENWHRWLFDRVAPGPNARILEVGCGPAEFWKRNLDRLDPTWDLTLTDLSPGMIDAAQHVLGERAAYAVADVQELPFGDGSFDVVLASHMLYHVADRPKSFSEVRRVLAPGGFFHAATNGEGHLQELGALAHGWLPVARHTESFGLASGPPQLEPFFADVTIDRFDNELAVTEVEPLLAYLRSSECYDGRDLAAERSLVEAAVTRDGVFRVTTTAGVISCRKP